MAKDTRLFLDGDLSVRLVIAGEAPTSCCVVTFAAFEDSPGLHRPGFGEAFFGTRGIDAVHVVPRGNQWYQYPGTLAAMASVRAAVQPYRRVVAYGSSMGAYAALRLASEAGAGAVLALSPQFSVRPAAVPFEYRWSSHGRGVADVWESTLPVPDMVEAVLVHDPRDLDSRHAALYAAAAPSITLVRLPGAGHPVTGFLHGVGMLEDLVLRACRDTLDLDSLVTEAWRERRRSAQHYRALGERAGIVAWQIGLFRRAAVLAPGNPDLQSRLGRALGQAGRIQEALALHREALRIRPGAAPLLREYAGTLAADGDLAGAAEQVEQLVAQGQPDAAAALADLRARLDGGAPTGGRRRRLVSIDPGARPSRRMPPIAAGRREVGYVMHGPLAELRPGRYEVTFTLQAMPGRSGRVMDRLDWRTACILDVATGNGETVLAERRIPVAALRTTPRTMTLPFTLPEWTACEFRVRSTGRTGLLVHPQRPVRRRRSAD